MAHSSLQFTSKYYNQNVCTPAVLFTSDSAHWIFCVKAVRVGIFQEKWKKVKEIIANSIIVWLLVNLINVCIPKKYMSRLLKQVPFTVSFILGSKHEWVNIKVQRAKKGKQKGKTKRLKFQQYFEIFIANLQANDIKMQNVGSYDFKKLISIA